MNNHKSEAEIMNIIIATLRGTPSARGKRVAPLKSGLFPSTNIFVVLTLGTKVPLFALFSFLRPSGKPDMMQNQYQSERLRYEE